MVRSLAVVGPLFLQDPSVARELLEALLDLPLNTPPERVINQAWLDVHWHDKVVRDVLTAICDLWDRAPEPAMDFLQVCWEHDDDCWHHFVCHEMLECHHAASLIYARFHQEGPVERVLDSMMFMRVLDESDRYAVPIMGDMVNRAAAIFAETGVCAPDILHLWRRYVPLQGLEPAAYSMLKAALGDKELAYRAMRVTECIAMKHVKPLLGAIARLATGSSTQNGTTRARHLLIDLGESRYHKKVAAAVASAPWHNYIAHLHPHVLWHLLDYLQAHRALVILADLLESEPASGIQRGAFTAFMACFPTRRERLFLVDYTASVFPVNAHDAIHYMYNRGEPPPMFFHEALRSHPSAVKAIARDAPLVRREVAWARRKLLVCCLARGAEGAGGPKRARRVLQGLQARPEAWPVVVQFL